MLATLSVLCVSSFILYCPASCLPLLELCHSQIVWLSEFLRFWLGGIRYWCVIAFVSWCVTFFQGKRAGFSHLMSRDTFLSFKLGYLFFFVHALCAHKLVRLLELANVHHQQDSQWLLSHLREAVPVLSVYATCVRLRGSTLNPPLLALETGGESGQRLVGEECSRWAFS